MKMKPFDKGGNCFIVGNFRDLETHIRETSDVVTQWFILAIPYSLDIILVASLLSSSYEVIDECLA